MFVVCLWRVVCCLWFVGVGSCLMLVVRVRCCSLVVVSCCRVLRFVVSFWLLPMHVFVVVCVLLFVCRCLLVVMCLLLFVFDVVCCSLFVDRCLLLVVCCCL